MQNIAMYSISVCHKACQQISLLYRSYWKDGIDGMYSIDIVDIDTSKTLQYTAVAGISKVRKTNIVWFSAECLTHLESGVQATTGLLDLHKLLRKLVVSK